MRRLPRLLVVLMLLLGAAGAVRATDVPIIGLKLIVVDKLMLASSAKAVFVAKDPLVTKGTGTDPTLISATLDIAYDSVSGTFDMPQGANWLVNSATVGKYVNKTAPTGGATKVGVIKPASLVKVVGKSLGDTPLDISSAPAGNVYVVDTIVNDGETIRLCTQFSGCVHKSIAADTGYKLICKGNSTEDALCTAAVSGPTTTTLPPATCCNAPLSSSCFDIGNPSDAAFCIFSGGTGASGVCDGATGSCQPTYGGESGCCRDAPGVPCVEGPDVDELLCVNAGGVFAQDSCADGCIPSTSTSSSTTSSTTSTSTSTTSTTSTSTSSTSSTTTSTSSTTSTTVCNPCTTLGAPCGCGSFCALTHCGSAGITLECMDDDVTPGSCTSDAGCAAGWSCTRHAGESPEACGGSGACRETDALRHPICCGGGPCAPCEH